MHKFQVPNPHSLPQGLPRNQGALGSGQPHISWSFPEAQKKPRCVWMGWWPVASLQSETLWLQNELTSNLSIHYCSSLFIIIHHYLSNPIYIYDYLSTLSIYVVFIMIHHIIYQIHSNPISNHLIQSISLSHPIESIIKLVGGLNPSEKSIGMMTFPIDGKIKFMFQSPPTSIHI